MAFVHKIVKIKKMVRKILSSDGNTYLQHICDYCMNL